MTLDLKSSKPSALASSATLVPLSPRLTMPLCDASSFNANQSSNPQLPKSTISSPAGRLLCSAPGRGCLPQVAK